MGKDEDSIEIIQILFTKQILFLSSSEFLLTLLQLYMRQKCKAVPSIK